MMTRCLLLRRRREHEVKPERSATVIGKARKLETENMVRTEVRMTDHAVDGH